jgi:hypothetical protein
MQVVTMSTFSDGVHACGLMDKEARLYKWDAVAGCLLLKSFWMPAKPIHCALLYTRTWKSLQDDEDSDYEGDKTLKQEHEWILLGYKKGEWNLVRTKDADVFNLTKRLELFPSADNKGRLLFVTELLEEHLDADQVFLASFERGFALFSLKDLEAQQSVERGWCSDEVGWSILEHEPLKGNKWSIQSFPKCRRVVAMCRRGLEIREYDTGAVVTQIHAQDMRVHGRQDSTVFVTAREEEREVGTWLHVVDVGK